MSDIPPDFAKVGAEELDPEPRRKRFCLPPASITWWRWLTDAGTAFVNGCIAGGKPGLVVGAGNGTQAATSAVEDISFRTVIGLAVTAVVIGVFEFISWHKSNPMPNPFFAAHTEKQSL